MAVSLQLSKSSDIGGGMSKEDLDWPGHQPSVNRLRQHPDAGAIFGGKNNLGGDVLERFSPTTHNAVGETFLRGKCWLRSKCFLSIFAPHSLRESCTQSHTICRNPPYIAGKLQAQPHQMLDRDSPHRWQADSMMSDHEPVLNTLSLSRTTSFIFETTNGRTGNPSHDTLPC